MNKQRLQIYRVSQDWFLEERVFDSGVCELNAPEDHLLEEKNTVEYDHRKENPISYTREFVADGWKINSAFPALGEPESIFCIMYQCTPFYNLHNEIEVSGGMFPICKVQVRFDSDDTLRVYFYPRIMNFGFSTQGNFPIGVYTMNDNGKFDNLPDVYEKIIMQLEHSLRIGYR
jgi:hypothetical protein